LRSHWFEQSALTDLLGEDFDLAKIHRLYQSQDKLLEHKQALFDNPTARWRCRQLHQWSCKLLNHPIKFKNSWSPWSRDDKGKKSTSSRLAHNDLAVVSC
jgi:hypothetical protein